MLAVNSIDVALITRKPYYHILIGAITIITSTESPRHCFHIDVLYYMPCVCRVFISIVGNNWISGNVKTVPACVFHEP